MQSDAYEERILYLFYLFLNEPDGLDDNMVSAGKNGHEQSSCKGNAGLLAGKKRAHAIIKIGNGRAENNAPD